MELGDAEVEAEEHAFDLVVQAFVDGEAAGGFRQKIDDGGGGAGVFFFEGHPVAELLEDGFGDGLVGMDEVGFGDVVFGGGEGFRETGVVGQNDQPGGGAVESAGEVKFLRPGLIDEIDDCAVIFIGGCGEDTDGFVEEEVAGGAGLEELAVGGKVIEFSERNAAIGDGLVVEVDLSGFDEFFCMTFPESAVFGDELRYRHVSGFFLQGGKRNGRR